MIGWHLHQRSEGPVCLGSLLMFLIWRVKETGMPRIRLPFWRSLPDWRNGLAEDFTDRTDWEAALLRGTQGLADITLNVHQSSLVVMKDNVIHSCISSSTASRLKEVIPLCWALVRLHLEQFPFLSPHNTKSFLISQTSWTNQRTTIRTVTSLCWFLGKMCDRWGVTTDSTCFT